MFCPSCGAPVEEHANFCPSCGADLILNAAVAGTGAQAHPAMARAAPAQDDAPFVDARKSPWAALLLSVLIPGLGHFYVGKSQRGLLILLVSIMSLGTGLFAIPMVLSVAILIWAVALVDAYGSAKEYNAFVESGGRPPERL